MLAIAVLVVAGCAGDRSGTRGSDGGAIIGEVGEPGRRAKAHTELAAMYYGVGNLGVALEELRIATRADPDFPQAYGMLGLVYMDLRETRLADESFGRALKLAPADADINHNYGWFLCQNGRTPESIKYFLRAVRNPLYPTPWRSYSAAGVCSVRNGNTKDAEEFFGRALKLEPNDLQSLIQLSEIRYRQGALEEARRLITRYNRLVEPTAGSLWLALRIERRLG
ncbi:MAG: type IV pilus biogenesis/stability protein PilW [Betaproteobacteria bacterium]|nr:type IV pilus biogenesis/stability protein PilW [Betaproteobacteria bacterium]